MPSTFSWLDHSDHDRRAILDAIDRFKESDTRDELGLGGIRDAFADMFFPGTSTIQTRARYFLFVPWMYDALERKVGADGAAARARKEELKLREALLASDDTDGVFGKHAGNTLKRLPSSIYWQGLGTWGIRLFPRSQEEYHRRFGDVHQRLRDAARDDDGDLVNGRAPRPWDPHLPPVPSGFPSEASFKLTVDEAQYLSHRICLSAPDSLLAFLVERGTTLAADYPWGHPQLAEFPPSVRSALSHAQLLAETMHGAAYLYNLLLAEELPSGERKDERIDTFQKEITRWVAEIGQREEAIRSWDRQPFWDLIKQSVTVRGSTQRFVEQWVQLAPWRHGAQLSIHPAARSLLRERERQLKGTKARLGNPRAIELWGGAAGTGRMSFRWAPARRLLRDIYAGLGRVITDAA